MSLERYKVFYILAKYYYKMYERCKDYLNIIFVIYFKKNNYQVIQCFVFMYINNLCLLVNYNYT